jgi:hypothetical protein
VGEPPLGEEVIPALHDRALGLLREYGIARLRE